MSNSILKLDMYNMLTSCIYGVLGGEQVVTPKKKWKFVTIALSTLVPTIDMELTHDKVVVLLNT